MEYYNINLWLGPAMNIHRNIRCGSNFEYYSEDPLVTGKTAAAIIRGVQSGKNRGATVKHFAGNNQEYNRLNSNSKINERALREIYLKGFQIAIEEAQPVALMTSYNLINRVHTSQNRQLLHDTLREEWNFKGLIMTDWIRSGQVEFQTSLYPAQFIHLTIKAGNNIMMPGSKFDYDLILEKMYENELNKDDLLKCASKVYQTIELLNQ
jgi:beta-glucosidase